MKHSPQQPLHTLRPCLIAIILIAACAGNSGATGQKGLKKQASGTVLAAGGSAAAATLVMPSTPATSATGAAYASRPEAIAFAADIAQRRGIDPDWAAQTLGQARFNATAARLMQPAASPGAKNWALYRSRNVEPIRIGAGVRYWQANRATLEKAEKTYGVPAAIIVGIIGVETIYGRDTGNFRVLDALATLAFDFPANHPRAQQRSDFFKGEIESFLQLQSRQGASPQAALAVRGSYAGAMGQPQFMPSSWQKYAVDFDGDGVIDLWSSAADTIGSVAHYLQAFGWQPGVATHYPVSFDATRLDMAALMEPDILPTFSSAEFAAKGAVLQNQDFQNHRGLLALIELRNGLDAPASYVAGTQNFYAITRYNWSSYYAMAVIELGQAVASQMQMQR